MWAYFFTSKSSFETVNVGAFTNLYSMWISCWGLLSASPPEAEKPVCTNSSTIETEHWTITTRHHFRLFWYHRSIPDLGYTWYLKWYKWWNQGSTLGVLHRKIKHWLTCLGEVWRKPWSLHWKKRKSRIFQIMHSYHISLSKWSKLKRSFCRVPLQFVGLRWSGQECLNPGNKKGNLRIICSTVQTLYGENIMELSSWEWPNRPGNGKVRQKNRWSPASSVTVPH